MTKHLKSIEQRAEAALREHGLTQEGWTFRWDRAVRNFGCCRHHQRRITLSKILCALNAFAAAEETILHEIAHALAGPHAGHGPKWVAQAKAIGCDGKRCFSTPVATPPPKWVGRCPACGWSTRRNRRRPRGACLSCCRRHNGGFYDKRFKIVWTPNDALEKRTDLIERSPRPTDRTQEIR
jgi:hypothetical protein